MLKEMVKLFQRWGKIDIYIWKQLKLTTFLFSKRWWLLLKVQKWRKFFCTSLVGRSPRPTECSVVPVYTRILDEKLVTAVNQIFDHAILRSFPRRISKQVQEASSVLTRCDLLAQPFSAFLVVWIITVKCLTFVRWINNWFEQIVDL